MLNKFYVYRWIRWDTMETFHVGKGCGNRYNNKVLRNEYFKRIAKSTICTVELMFTNLTEQKAFSKEVEMIAYYKDLGQCSTNFTAGGTGSTGAKHAEEAKQKIGAASKGNKHCLGHKNHAKKHSEESKLKISKAKTGKKCLEETKGKMSKAHKGKVLSEEHKIKLRKPKTEEHKQNMSKARKGIKNSIQHKQNMSKARKGVPWTQARIDAQNKKDK